MWGKKERGQRGGSVSWREMGRRRGGGRKGDVLIVDGSGADSCNDLICLCAWRWKDQPPPERIAPSFSVNRVNYLYNEICKVVNFSSSLFSSFSALYSSSHFQLISIFCASWTLLLSIHPSQEIICLFCISINIISLHFSRG